jgi:hypothetical protein
MSHKSEPHQHYILEKIGKLKVLEIGSARFNVELYADGPTRVLAFSDALHYSEIRGAQTKYTLAMESRIQSVGLTIFDSTREKGEILNLTISELLYVNQPAPIDHQTPDEKNWETLIRCTNLQLDDMLVNSKMPRMISPHDSGFNSQLNRKKFEHEHTDEDVKAVTYKKLKKELPFLEVID